MDEHEGREEPRRSKFEWRADDVVILSPEEAARALAEDHDASRDIEAADGDPAHDAPEEGSGGVAGEPFSDDRWHYHEGDFVILTTADGAIVPGSSEKVAHVRALLDAALADEDGTDDED